MVLNWEATEIIELFEWLTEEESRNLVGETVGRLDLEIGDVMIDLANLNDKFGLDPIVAAKRKIGVNT